MAFWRYLRDVMIVVAVLLLVSGLLVSWWVFCVVVYLVALIASLIWDHKKYPGPKRPF